VEGAVTALRCRTSDRSDRASRGAEALALEVGVRLGVHARMVGELADPRAQDWADDLRDSRGCLLEAGGQVDDALSAGRFGILTAGHCSIALTTLPTVALHRPEAKILWLDAHGDYNTPQTTSSGFLGGMPLAGACGEWDAGFDNGGRLKAEHVVLCGVRDLDEGERELLERSPATVIGPSLETLVALQNALDGAPTYVHLDCDVLDPEVMPAEFPAAGGLTEEKLYDLLDAVADSCEVVGLEVTALNAPERAARVADLIEPLLPKDGHGID
jgi:arginase family enzyme